MANEKFDRPEWDGFEKGKWSDGEVNVRDFIQRNYTPYEGDESFLAPATEATEKLWNDILELSEKERAAGGVLKADTAVVSTLTSHGAGYIDKDLEKIVGLQTELILLVLGNHLREIAHVGESHIKHIWRL